MYNEDERVCGALPRSMASPLHQFEIHTVVPCNAGNLDISLTNSSLMMIFVTVMLCTLMHMTTRQKRLVPTRTQMAGELFFQFIGKLVSDQIGPEGRGVFPYILTLFSFILFSNVMGLIPYSFTVTSHLAVTLSLALMVFVGMTVLGIVRHRGQFFRLFLPSGVPWWIAFILVPVEVISYCVRPFSLAVRLFANMMAGHIILKLLAGAAVFCATHTLGKLSIAPAAVFPILFNVIMLAFELFVAGLQAYIFTILSCIYLNSVLHLE